jgi:CRP-like cAMP-binding protein
MVELKYRSKPRASVMNTTQDEARIRNRVLLATRPQAQQFLTDHSEIRPLVSGDTIYASGQEVTHAILPHDGILSYMAQIGPQRVVEKASIGAEGFVGFTYLMGGGPSLSDVVVTVDGYASWLPLDALNEAMQRFICVREAMLAYAQGLIVQLMETVACNSLHTAEQRVARWLLVADDRTGAPEFRVTQDAIAQMLGLRRATVSQVCSDLMQAGAIAYSRGRLTVMDRERLASFGCECYRRIQAVQLQPFIG